MANTAPEIAPKIGPASSRRKCVDRGIPVGVSDGAKEIPLGSGRAVEEKETDTSQQDRAFWP